MSSAHVIGTFNLDTKIARGSPDEACKILPSFLLFSLLLDDKSHIGFDLWKACERESLEMH